jgi:hypothetical protein
LLVPHTLFKKVITGKQQLPQVAVMSLEEEGHILVRDEARCFLLQVVDQAKGGIEPWRKRPGKWKSMLAMAGYHKVDLPASTTPYQSPAPPGGELFKSIDGKPGPGWKDRVVRFFARLLLPCVQLVSADVVPSLGECFQQAEKEC